MEQDDARWLAELGRDHHKVRKVYPKHDYVSVYAKDLDRLLSLAKECLMLRAKKEDRKRSGAIVVSQEDKEWLESLESTMDLVEQNDNITFKGLAPEAFRRLLVLAKK